VISKPLVDYDRNHIQEVNLPVEGVKVVIVEGTYTTLLKNVDLRAFIDRDFRQTRKARVARSRDPLTDFIEKVLLIEHEIISGHRQLADLVIPPPEDEQ
jgi:uridine kinase